MTGKYEICCENGRRYSTAAPKRHTIAIQPDSILSNILLETDGSILKRSIYSQAKTFLKPSLCGMHHCIKISACPCSTLDLGIIKKMK